MMLARRPGVYAWRARMIQSFKEKKTSLLSWFRLIPLIFLVLVALAACGGSSSASGPAVSAIDNTFSPKELHIKPGQTVTWVNNGQSPHTVTADDKSFDSGIFASGAQYTHTFIKPGKYPYYCTLHGGPGGSGMAGVVIVDAPSSNTTSVDLITRSPATPRAILRVPETYSTIQAAV